MGRTYHTFFHCRYDTKLGYAHKSKRARNKKLSNQKHSSHRNDNRFADRITFNTFNNGKYKDICHWSWKAGQLIGNRFHAQLQLQELFSRQSSEQTLIQKISRKIRQLLYRQDSNNHGIGSNKQRTRRVSDLYLAAYKQLKRRGTIGTFCGHRDRKQLYKRQLYFF